MTFWKFMQYRALEGLIGVGILLAVAVVIAAFLFVKSLLDRLR
jgi:hypothetical protein